jgi:threonine dehydrogenase-like Zn-dependent dehydrogenase
MRGIWLEEEQVRLRDDLPVPEPLPGEALVRVRLAGICKTDLELVKGYYPFRGILGHEFVGTVEEAPGWEQLKGRRVVGEINVVCGRCDQCRQARSSHCSRRTVLGISGRDGAFAEFLTLPVQNLHPVAPTLPDEIAVFVEPLAAACRILEQVHVAPGDRVLVLGAGKLGQLAARALAQSGANVVVAARYPRQQEALQLGGLACCQPEETLGGFDLVVESTGSPAGLREAVSLVRPEGTLVLKSTYHGTAELDFSRLVVDEIRIIGSRCGPFEPALRWLEAGRVDPAPLIEAIVDWEEALAILTGRNTARGSLKFLLAVKSAATDHSRGST